MKFAKILGILILVYIGIVILFETVLGTYQPRFPHTMEITTFDVEGVGHSRVVARLESGGQLYVAVNHWPRAWYRRLLENPQMKVTYQEEIGDYIAVEVRGAERERVDREYSLAPGFRILTGFPPRHIVRLDPR